jgi:hypothetical protein
MSETHAHQDEQARETAKHIMCIYQQHMHDNTVSHRYPTYACMTVYMCICTVLTQDRIVTLAMHGILSWMPRVQQKPCVGDPRRHLQIKHTHIHPCTCTYIHPCTCTYIYICVSSTHILAHAHNTQHTCIHMWVSPPAMHVVDCTNGRVCDACCSCWSDHLTQSPH